MSQDSVRSLMSTRVIYVLPTTPILTAIDIILSNNYNGLPVTNKDGVLVGILTKYDLITKRGSLRDDMTVKDAMNMDPLTLDENMTVDDAIRAFSEHHKVDPIPVVDSNKKVVGVISRYDMVKLFKEYGLSGSASGTGFSGTVKTKNSSSGLIIAGVILVILGVAVYYYFS